jgi:hypothetical protein
MLSALLSRLMGNTPPPKEDGLRIVEGVESIWSYHLADGPQRNALCDPKLTMMATARAICPSATAKLAKPWH